MGALRWSSSMGALRWSSSMSSLYVLWCSIYATHTRPPSMTHTHTPRVLRMDTPTVSISLSHPQYLSLSHPPTHPQYLSLCLSVSVFHSASIYLTHVSHVCEHVCEYARRYTRPTLESRGILGMCNQCRASATTGMLAISNNYLCNNCPAICNKFEPLKF